MSYSIFKWDCLVEMMRKVIKQFVPFDVQRLYMEHTYGLYLIPANRRRSAAAETLIGFLPYGLVRRLFAFRLSSIPIKRARSPFWLKLIEPRYRFGLCRRIRFVRERIRARAENASLIEKNRDVRILVVLHLFYPKAWAIIKMYLDNIRPYRRTDIIVTYVPNTLSGRLLKKLAAYSPNVTLLPCLNKGFDVGPFVEALRTVDLNAYDIVFKLQSKGIKRRRIFIYGQIFKGADWFFNLWDGVLGGGVVHKVINLLVKGDAKLVAAENLIVHDPPHKQRFVKSFCEERNLPFVENYHYVAGSMFAVQADILSPLKSLELKCDDFPETERGKFSMAHALERWICFAANNKMYGIPTFHRDYVDEVKRAMNISALRLLDDPRIKLNDEFFYRRLETRPVRSYKIVPMKLKDIRRKRYDGSVVTIEECEPYRYLLGEVEQYGIYCENNLKESGYDMSRSRYDALAQSMEKMYDPRCMPVVAGRNNILLDGQHRCCWLYHKFGPEYEINVLKLTW